MIKAPSLSAAKWPVLVRRECNNETVLVSENEIMKLCLQANHFNTTPHRVRPPGAEIEEGNLLATS
jgi:hypothetical protein